ncbi:MAG: phosphatidylserine decarboxylase [Gammaproteobacteria bacterium]|nr:MAG: phosphatidylserine decarboxylase [Gammaproteobacteria bacterium]
MQSIKKRLKTLLQSPAVQSSLEMSFLWAQRIIPQHALSRAIGFFAESQLEFIKTPLINWFIKTYQVNMDEAICANPSQYPNFNLFFTRALGADARPLCEQANSIACPADGAISQLGNIDQDNLFQAKGHTFNLKELLGSNDKDTLAQFQDGKFMTIYLSPKDYHRVHMPVTGQLKKMTYIPGKLFSVNSVTTRHQPKLFANNERMVAYFETESGPMAMIMVGAMIVAAIETVWHGKVAPSREGMKEWDYARMGQEFRINKGDEMGQFYLGSTVILLFGKDAMHWDSNLYPDRITVMGEQIGQTLPKAITQPSS